MKKITALIILLTLSELALATTIVCSKDITSKSIQGPHYLKIDAENEKIESFLVLADEDKGIYFDDANDVNEYEFRDRHITYADSYRINRYSFDWEKIWDLPTKLEIEKLGKCRISDKTIEDLKMELDEIKNRKRKI